MDANPASFTVSTSIPSAKYGDHEVDFTSLPPGSIAKLLRGGLAHFLGNETASRVSAEKKTAEEQGVPLSPEDLAKVKADYMAEALENLRTGKVNTAVRGPRGTTLDAVFNKLVIEKATSLLRLNNLSMPSGDKVCTFPNGDALSRGQIIERVTKRYGEVLRVEAQKAMDKAQRDAAKALAAAQASGAEGIEALGF